MDENFIAERLAKLRTERGVSARTMSLDIGQASNYIASIESGKKQPSIQGLYYICDYFKITPSEFFDEKTASPSLLNEVMDELKPLNGAALSHILGLARELRGR